MKRYDPMVEAAKPLFVLYIVAIIIGLILGIICWIFDIRI
nr:MAG TPA: Lipopolysaccharide assembly protein A domain [Herelleviridae sp.]